MTVAGRGTFPLETVSETEFVLVVVGLNLRFETNDDGAWDLTGQRLEYPRWTATRE